MDQFSGVVKQQRIENVFPIGIVQGG